MIRQQNKAKDVHYEYTKLKDADVGNDGTVNFYAIVLDSNFPHKSFKSDRFTCSIKITDPDQPLDQEGVSEHCTLVMFAKRYEDLPITQRVGDIIRVHRAYVGQYKGVKQFTANIFFNSSWALFSPLNALQAKAESVEESKEDKKIYNEREYLPFTFFGRSFSFEKSEQRLIKQFREWINKTFAKHHVVSDKYITPLAEVPQKGGKQPDSGKYYDFDLQVKVVQLFRLDDYSSEIRVIDESNEIWYCHILNMKYKWVREGQILRIRSASIEHHEKYERVFGLKNYSNILSLPYNSIIGKEINVDIPAAQHQVDLELLKSDQKIMHPVIASSIHNQKVRFAPLETLEQILQQKPQGAGKLHRTRITVEGSNPDIENISQFIRIQNTKTNAIREIGKTKAVLSKDERFILYFQFYVQDHSNYLSNQFVRVLVCDPLEKGKGLFKNLTGDDLKTALKGKKQQSIIQETLKNLLKFNVWMEAAIEVLENGLLVIRDTQINEY